MAFKKYIFLFVLFALQLTIAAQDSIIADSLEVVLSKTSNQEEKLKTLLSLSDALLYTDLSKALKYGEEAYKLAVSESDKKVELSAFLDVKKEMTMTG